MTRAAGEGRRRRRGARERRAGGRERGGKAATRWGRAKKGGGVGVGPAVGPGARRASDSLRAYKVGKVYITPQPMELDYIAPNL
jgi:hypothetical protein